MLDVQNVESISSAATHFCLNSCDSFSKKKQFQEQWLRELQRVLEWVLPLLTHESSKNQVPCIIFMIHFQNT